MPAKMRKPDAKLVKVDHILKLAKADLQQPDSFLGVGMAEIHTGMGLAHPVREKVFPFLFMMNNLTTVKPTIHGPGYAFCL